MAGRAELQRRLATEFERQGWSYEPDIGPALLDYIAQSGPADGATLAQRVSADFLDRHNITRGAIAPVLDRALGGKTVEADLPFAPTLVYTDNSIHIGGQAQVTDSQLNTAGNQLVIQETTSKHELLAVVSALVRSGLAGHWNEGAARELAQAIDSRADITIEDVREIATAAAEAEEADAGRIKVLVTKISTGAISGALGAGIVAALGALF